MNDREVTTQDLTRILREELDRLKQEKTKTEANFDWYGDEDDDSEEKTLDKNPTPMPDDTKDSK